MIDFVEDINNLKAEIEVSHPDDNKRSRVRYEAYLLVSDGDNFIGFIEDINDTGAKILFSKKLITLNMTKIQNIVIDASKYNLSELKFKFRIIWQKDFENSSLSEIGVAFYDIDFENLSKLRLLLKALEEEGAKKIYYQELLNE